MSTSGQMRYDDYLTNVGLAYPTGNLIAGQLAPVIPADNYSDYVFVDGDDAINQVNDMAEEVPSNEVDFSIGTPYSYRTTRKALSSIITDKKLRNASKTKVVRLEMRETNKLVHRLKMKHEIRIATVLNDATKVTQTAALSGTARWDSTAADLEASIITAAKTINDATGLKPNTIVMPFAAALYAAKMDFIADTLQYQYGMQVVTAEFQRQVMNLVGLPPVIKGLNLVISDGRKNDANDGQTASVVPIWDKNCLIRYVPPSTGVDTMMGLATMEFDSLKISKEKKVDPRGIKVLAEWDYDILEADLNCWYLLTSVIS